MADRIVMPKTGMTMEEGIIIEWFKREGDPVTQGDVIAEIETDKSTMELESDYNGTLLKILYPAGATVPVVRTIAWIGEPGEELPDEDPAGPDSDDNSKPAVEPRVKATPAARRSARERGVNLERIQPGGKNGEVREVDVLKAADVITGPDELIIDHHDKLVRLTGIQKITGARMFKAYSEIPAVTENSRADVTELLRIRENLNREHDGRISINDFIILATAKMLKLHPRLNASLVDSEHILLKGSINIGFAVATSRGLLVPVVRDADTMTLSGISAKAGELADKARNGGLATDEMSGGTFTVSNLGMYGVTSFTPIINQPEACILGVCSIEDQLRKINGEIENRKILNLSLTFDHRVLDGADAAAAIKTLRGFLEAPQTILA